MKEKPKKETKSTIDAQNLFNLKPSINKTQNQDATKKTVNFD